MELLHQRCGPHVTTGNQFEVGVADTQQYYPHKEEMQNAEMLSILDEEPEVTPAWGDQFSSASFRAHLAPCMQELGYQSCDAYHDL